MSKIRRKVFNKYVQHRSKREVNTTNILVEKTVLGTTRDFICCCFVTCSFHVMNTLISRNWTFLTGASQKHTQKTTCILFGYPIEFQRTLLVVNIFLNISYEYFKIIAGVQKPFWVYDVAASLRLALPSLENSWKSQPLRYIEVHLRTV